MTDLSRLSVGRIVCRATRAERYACGHTLMGDAAYEPTRETAAVVVLNGPCRWCRKLASWTQGETT